MTYAASATDAVDPSPALRCSPPSGATFAIGTTTVTCTATDRSGNRSSASFMVTVKGADAQLGDVIGLIGGWSLHHGTATSLTQKLRSARSALAGANERTACNVLGATLNEVRAQSGKKLTVAQAGRLTTDVGRIKVVIGC